MAQGVTTNFKEFATALASFAAASALAKTVTQVAGQELAKLQHYPTRMAATPGTSGLHSNGNYAKRGRMYYKRGTGAFYRRKSGTDTHVSDSENLKDNWAMTVMPQALTIFNTVSYAGYVMGASTDDKPQTTVMKTRGWRNLDDSRLDMNAMISAVAPDGWKKQLISHMLGKGFSIV